MKKVHDGRPEAGEPKVVHISRARRLAVQGRPQAEPPCEMKTLWNTRVSESSRAVFIQSELRLDLDTGDPFGWILKKANYAVENGNSAFASGEARAELALGILSVLADYGEPEGMRLVRRIRELYGGRDPLSRAISLCTARIGAAADLDLIIGGLDSDRSSPAHHIGAALQLAERFPSCTGQVIEELEKRKAINGVEDALSSLGNRGK